MTTMKIITSLLLLIFSSFIHAQWFQASATATIINGNIEEAREQAVKKAVKDALLFSGGTIASLQQVNQGVLTENELILNSSGEINALHIIDEKQKDHQLTVKVKVDISAKPQRCLGSKFPKSMVVSRFAIKVPEQTVDGQIYDLNKKVGETLFKQLSLSPNLFNIRAYIDKPLKLGEKYNNKQQSTTLTSLASKTDSQYVLFGEINDLSVKFQDKLSLGYWMTNPDRHFYMTIYLYDALQGELIFTKQYRHKTKWRYGREEQADLNSKLFWEREYGQAILNTLDQVNTDLSYTTQCTVPYARIVSVESNHIHINLGSSNGLQVGTLINLNYSSNFIDQFGIERPAKTVSQQPMRVIQVHKNSAILETIEDFPLTNIQINDIATIRPL